VLNKRQPWQNICHLHGQLLLKKTKWSLLIIKQQVAFVTYYKIRFEVDQINVLWFKFSVGFLNNCFNFCIFQMVVKSARTFQKTKSPLIRPDFTCSNIYCKILENCLPSIQAIPLISQLFHCWRSGLIKLEAQHWAEPVLLTFHWELLIPFWSINKHGHHRQFLFLIVWFLKQLFLWNRLAKWYETW
jgi:hypothetical protein